MLYVKNALTRKNLMALTGLFLSFFLIIHLFGNLQLLLPEEEAKLQYNWYSHLLAGNIVVKVIAIVLYICILLHTIDAIYLSLKSKKANGPRYAIDKRGRASKWYSRNMMFLGSIIFLFLIIHFKDFWYHFKFGQLPVDKNGNKDLYTLVIAAFDQLWYVILYVIAIIALGYHLLHGVFSAHRTLGLYHPLYSKIVKFLGMAYAIIMTMGYIAIPIFIYLNR
ncbi:succinate dehydrogenase cytochrome b subunit [Kriegella aquimaris]|uniref:Succinate dehydrogenase / fumarate reductase cytochrome b subunit n=1 Tax=Kriegella aquimaris TaxID=192904 RepID=A0A1G9S820_9FLAO|nr:succinate dehydrogenase cytochrome b subunit [Kriegella aquimaris]SDM31480.1 succinate dehydrogenase / fumarate reductase cytochrome b subunit [Kriegella aquimaris]